MFLFLLSSSPHLVAARLYFCFASEHMGVERGLGDFLLIALSRILAVLLVSFELTHMIWDLTFQRWTLLVVKVEFWLSIIGVRIIGSLSLKGEVLLKG